MNKYELLQQTSDYSISFLKDNALNMVVNSENSMSSYELDKFLKGYFTKVERAFFGSRKRKRGDRIERLVTLQNLSTRVHAHILINPGSLSVDKLKMVLQLVWNDVWDRKSTRFTMYLEKNRSAAGSSIYNNRELLVDDESVNALGSISTFIKKSPQLRVQAEQKQRELLDERLGKKVSDKAWSIKVKQLEKQQKKEKNGLRRQKQISKNRALKKK